MPVEIEVIVEIPEIKLQSEFLRHKMSTAMRTKTVPELVRLFRGTTEGWSHKPNWSQRYRNSPDIVSATVWATGPNKKIYGYVNFGTKEHRINPKRGGMLRYREDYRAATRPGSILSRAPKKFGRYVARKNVWHPGNEAREFDMQIAKIIAPKFAEDIQQALRIF